MTVVTSAMRDTMERQGEALARIIDNSQPIAPVADRIRGRQVLLVGTGTSFHAAQQGAYLLRHAGLAATAAASADIAIDGTLPASGTALIALTHTGRRKRFTAEVMDHFTAAGGLTIQISAIDVVGADLTTVQPERSAAYSASHLGALLRIAQLAAALGAKLGDLAAIPAAVDAAYRDEAPPLELPSRLLEFIGGGINQWTAAEGALKAREAAYVATQGLATEQFLHGPSGALRSCDRLVCLDGGGEWAIRVAEVADAAEASGVPVSRIRHHELSEPLSIFPLTSAVQRIALEAAETLGTNPDSFGRDISGREPWHAIPL